VAIQSLQWALKADAAIRASRSGVRTLSSPTRFAEITQMASLESPMVDDDVDDPNGAFNLSPVQQMFLGQPKLPTQFHSSIYPRILEDVEISLVTSAIEGIVRRHSMLRARFTWGENGWQQNIVNDVPNPYSFEVHDIEDETRIREVVAAMHGLLDIVDGPVFATDIFNTNSGAKRLILVAHHLVVNLVYWQTIL